MTTLYTVTVDTEEEWDWGSGFPTHGYGLKNIRELPRFQEVCTAAGAAVTYFTGDAVLRDPASCDIVRHIASQPSVEIGLHIHPWNTAPLHTNGPTTTRESFLANLPRETIRAKLGTVYESFLDAGFRPSSFRGGRYSSGGVIHDFLREHRFVADASVVPYTTWSDDGAPDYRHRDLKPVRLPPRHDQEHALWEIPLTLGFTRGPQQFWARAFEIIEHSPLRRLRLIGLAERLGLIERIWLNFECPTGRNMLPFLRKLRQWKLPCVCLTLHSSSLMAGGNHYTPDKRAQERIFTQVHEVLECLAGWDDFQPATVTQVAEHLERGYHESSRYQPA